MQKNTFTDDELLEMLRLKAKQLKRTPRRDEFQQRQAIVDRFGSWNNGILKAGLYLSNKQMLDLLKNELKRLNTTDDKIYDENKRKEFPSVVSYEKRFHCSWQDLMKIIKPEKSKLRHNMKSRKEFLNILIDLEKELGYIPSSQEIKKYGYDESIFVDKFISYNNAVLAAKMEIDLKNKLKLKTKKSISKKPKHRTNKYSKEQLKEILLKEYNKLGRKLTPKEIDNNKNIPSLTTFKRHFKTTGLMKIWDEILNNDEER